MQDIRIWLDDVRLMPDFYNVHLKSAQEAMNLIEAGGVTHISLDHDLGTMLTGYDVAKYIESHAYSGGYRFNVQVHTANPVGKKNIMAAIANAMRFWLKNDTERFDMVSCNGSVASWVAIMGLVLNKKVNGGELPEAENGQLKIQLSVNGKTISFVETVEELYNRISANVDKKAAALAEEKLKEHFSKLENTVYNAHALIRNKIFESFGVDITGD